MTNAPILFLIAWGVAGPLVHAQAPPTGRAPGGPTVTRLVQMFTGLETEWMDAARRRDKAALERFLADDYELRISSLPGEPIPREEWLQAAMNRYNLRSFTIGQMAVRELGDAALVSFLYSQEADVEGRDRSGDFFVIDAWVQKDGVWKVKARYAGPVEGRPLPGSAKKTGG
jgi:ketosteroid isomerase-like protein